MLVQLVDVGALSVYRFVANVKEYTLLESMYGTYQIVKDSKPIAHPATAEDAWQRIKLFSGSSNPEPQCWRSCKPHNCADCERYYD
jgi:hypothetical protein